MKRRRLTSGRAVLREHPEVRGGGWKALPVPVGLRAAFPACGQVKRFLLNREVSVQIYEVQTDWGVVDHLLVRPHNGLPIRDWYKLQKIKDDVVGADRVAVEVFPRSVDLRDAGVAIYHLWVLPPGFELPFGMHLPGGGMVAS